MKIIDIIAQSLDKANVGISNALSTPDIKTLLTKKGYDTAKLNEGKGLYQTALAKTQKRQAKVGEQLIESNLYQDAVKLAQASYQELATSCRALWPGDAGKLSMIGLNKAMPKSHSGFIKTATTLYNTGNYEEGMLEELNEHRFGEAEFEAGLEVITAMDKANQDHEKCKGEKQNASREQRTALKALRVWMARYRKFARLALKGSPEYAEKLGILSRTTKTAAQRAAKARAKKQSVNPVVSKAA